VLLWSQSFERPKYRASQEQPSPTRRTSTTASKACGCSIRLRTTLIAEINYLNDKKHGLCNPLLPAQRHGDGAVPSTSMAGRHGAYKKYFYSGSLRTEGEYDFNKRTGYWVNYYHTTGEINSEGNYVNGKKDGDWKFYDSKGVLKLTYTYKAGVLVAQNGVSLEELKKQEKNKSQTITTPK
jgi:hypothetical protein